VESVVPTKRRYRCGRLRGIRAQKIVILIL